MHQTMHRRSQSPKITLSSLDWDFRALELQRADRMTARVGVAREVCCETPVRECDVRHMIVASGGGFAEEDILGFDIAVGDGFEMGVVVDAGYAAYGGNASMDISKSFS